MSVRVHCPQCNASDEVGTTFDGEKAERELAEAIAEWHDDRHHDGAMTAQVDPLNREQGDPDE